MLGIFMLFNNATSIMHCIWNRNVQWSTKEMSLAGRGYSSVQLNKLLNIADIKAYPGLCVDYLIGLAIISTISQLFCLANHRRCNKFFYFKLQVSCILQPPPTQNNFIVEALGALGLLCNSFQKGPTITILKDLLFICFILYNSNLFLSSVSFKELALTFQ